MIQENTLYKRNIDIFDLIKIKNVCSSKDTVESEKTRHRL